MAASHGETRRSGLGWGMGADEGEAELGLALSRIGSTRRQLSR